MVGDTKKSCLSSLAGAFCVAVSVTCFEDSVVNLDGESLHSRDVTFALSEHKLRFFYPRGLRYTATVQKREEAGVI